MEERFPVRHPSLTSQILEILARKIQAGEFTTDQPLPTENQLAAEYQVSRATVRTAMARLEATGLIYRRPGVGTFVRRPSMISNPLNRFIDFFALIRENGYEPGFEQIYAAVVEPDQAARLSLHLEPGERALEVHKIFYADGDPIIFCTNIIPEWVFKDALTDEQAVAPGLTEPFFAFFESTCRQRIEYYISNVRAAVIGGCSLPPNFSREDPNLPVLVIDEVGYNAEERPVHQSIEYHPGNRMNFKLIRSR